MKTNKFSGNRAHPKEGYYTAEEVCEVLGICRNTLQNHVRTKKLLVARQTIARHLYFEKQYIDDKIADYKF